MSVKSILSEQSEVGLNWIAAWRPNDFIPAIHRGKAINLCYSAPVKEFHPREPLFSSALISGRKPDANKGYDVCFGENNPPEFWNRAIGWYVMAMADVMDWLPTIRPGRKEVLPIFQSLCHSLLNYQDRNSGMWYRILDKPSAPKNYSESGLERDSQHRRNRVPQDFQVIENKGRCFPKTYFDLETAPSRPEPVVFSIAISGPENPVALMPRRTASLTFTNVIPFLQFPVISNSDKP